MDSLLYLSLSTTPGQSSLHHSLLSLDILFVHFRLEKECRPGFGNDFCNGINIAGWHPPQLGFERQDLPTS